MRDKFEQKEMKKIRPSKNTQFDWLINYIPESIRKSEVGFRDKIGSHFKTNTPKQTVYGREKKLSKPKTQNTRHQKCFYIKKENKKELKIE